VRRLTSARDQVALLAAWRTAEAEAEDTRTCEHAGSDEWPHYCMGCRRAKKRQEVTSARRIEADRVDFRWERDGRGDWILVTRNPDGNPVALPFTTAPSLRTSAWYHTSPRRLPVGTDLVPGGGGHHDRFYRAIGDPDRASHVWVEDDPRHLKRWHDIDAETNYHYRVEPDGDPAPYRGDASQGYVVPRARVVEELGPARRKKGSAEDYRGSHQPPGPDWGYPLHDMDVGDDWYQHPDWYGGNHSHVSGMGKLQVQRMYNRARGNPDHPVTVYRALPHGHDHFNTGDWVTPSLEYARGHAVQSDDPAEDWPVIAATVPASHLWQNGDSYYEMGYHGPPTRGELT
jgi:hypothetical protein